MLDRSVFFLAAILTLPLLVCLAIILLVPGIDPALLTHGLTLGALLVAGGVALSFAASFLSARSGRR